MSELIGWHRTTNPIFAEYYSHVGEDCYKILLPWSPYKQHSLVLCPVSKGLKGAQRLARKAIKEHLNVALLEAIKEGTE